MFDKQTLFKSMAALNQVQLCYIKALYILKDIYSSQNSLITIILSTKTLTVISTNLVFPKLVITNTWALKAIHKTFKF